MLTSRMEDTDFLYAYAGCLMSMWYRNTENFSLLSTRPPGCRRCSLETLHRKCVWLHTAYVNCVIFLPMNQFFWIAFGLRLFCTLNLTTFCLVFLYSCVSVLLTCSYLLISGCKIVQVKANTFGLSNDNRSKYYTYCQPTHLAKGLDVTARPDSVLAVLP
jgi:hypothetical protein